MRILLSNDDGVLAPGLNILKNVLSSFAEVYVVAPMEEKSAAGHGLTLSHPVRVTQIEEKVWGVSGYPADCVLMALRELCPHISFDVMVSGINHGANMGQEIYYSGTVAAAREASFNGLKSLAVSLVTDAPMQGHPHFETAASFVKEFLQKSYHEKIGAFQMVNINVPNLNSEKIKGAMATKLGFRHYSNAISKRFDTSKRPYYWMGGHFEGPEKIEGSDGMAILDHFISVTPIDILPEQSENSSELFSFVNKTFAVTI